MVNIRHKLIVAIRRNLAHNKVVIKRLDTSSLLAGSLLGSLAVVVINLLLTIHVYRVTGSSPVAVSVLFVITFMPNLVIAPLFSGLSDRWNRRLLLGGCGLARGLLCLLLLFNWQLPVLLLLAFGITSASAISKPARYALAAQLTTGPERVAMNSLLMIVGTVAGIVGGGVSAYLTSMASREVFALTALISVVGGILDMVRFRQAPAPVFKERSSTFIGNGNDDTVPSEDKTSTKRDFPTRRLVNGLRLIWYTPALLALTIATTILWFGLGIKEPLLVIFVDRVLAAPDSTYPLLTTVGSIGGLLGAAATTSLARNPSVAARRFSLSLLLAGICFIAFSYSNGSIAVAFIAFFLFDSMYSVSNVIDEYLEQELSPDHLRATVISAIGAVGTFGYLLGGGLTGFAVSNFGVEATVTLTGVIIVVAGIYGLFKLRIDPEVNS